LVERAATGGDCLWTGCVPSKSLIAAAGLAQHMRSADRLGLEPVEPQIDFARVMARVRAVRDAIEPQDSPERLRREGVDVIEGQARFVRRGEIDVDGRMLRYRWALIATGSRPIVPPVAGLEEASPLTTETVWDLDRLPPRLLVLGGGPIGCELAQAFRRLGSAVTVIEMAERLLLKEEPAASRLIAERFAAEGIGLRLDSYAIEVGAGNSGHAVVVQRPGGRETIECDAILVATGRQPETASLGLDAVGVQTDQSGAVVVDRRLRTTAAGIFAGGDVTGALPFTHVAAYHGRLVVTNALLGMRRRVDYRAVPWVTFTDPEIARVGVTEAQARERWGERAIVQRYDYAELDRALTAAEAEGFVTLVGDPRGRLVGATVAAAEGGESIAELTAWCAQRAKIDRVSQTVHAYPTFAEGAARAADEYLRAKYFNDRVRRVVRPLIGLRRVLRRG
jgi:pyruvate/2-oxoglutarate dehydrogenase complex dihydrolipoamide dehydrogenase (E3) component